MDAQGNPIKDAKGRFLKGDLIAYAVMEKRTGWGTEYGDDIRNGEWEYSAFGADGKFNDKANYKACFQCHKPHDQIDFVISYPALAGRTMVASAAPAPAGSIGSTSAPSPSARPASRSPRARPSPGPTRMIRPTRSRWRARRSRPGSC